MMKIRALGEENLTEASAIVEKQWGVSYAGLFLEEARRYLPDPSACIYGAFAGDGTLAGIGMISKDQIDFSLWGVTWLVVGESFRGSGYGKDLLAALEGFACVKQSAYPVGECLILLTTTIPDFYARLGYEPIKDWKDTVLMIKDLSDRTI